MGSNASRVPGVRVECYAGYRGEETPRRLFIDDRELTVENVIERWISPGHRYFEIRGDDGHVYVIRHDVDADCWQVTRVAGWRRDTYTL